MKKLLIYFLLFLSSAVFAQDKFQAVFDYAVFNNDDSVGIVELYYGFYPSGMMEEEIEGVPHVRGELDVFIRNTANNSVAVNKKWNFTQPKKTVNGAKFFSGLLRFQLPVGKYECEMSGIDGNKRSQRTDFKFSFEIKKMVGDRFSLSDLILATQINQFNLDEQSIFYRNTLEVIPNPELVYGENQPVVFFYGEIYNLMTDIKSEKLKIEHYIYDSRNRVKYRKTKEVPRNNSSIVEAGAINIKKFPTGTYNLIVAATDPVKKLTVSSSKKFFILNPSIVDTSGSDQIANDVLASELGVMTIEELDEAFELAVYLASEDEKSAWESVNTLEGKRNYLYNFWKKRDPNPSTPINEAKVEYYKRIDFANKNFKNMGQPDGWKTDRGRVYLVYGSPSEVERHPNEENVLPYEIWFYNEIENGVQFVFADFSGYNDYRLIHSDMRGELSNVNWQDRIGR